MSHPHAQKNSTPGDFGQTKTVFITEGNSSAILVENKHGHRRQRKMRFADAHAALTWCQAKRAALVYSPATEDLSKN